MASFKVAHLFQFIIYSLSIRDKTNICSWHFFLKNFVAATNLYHTHTKFVSNTHQVVGGDDGDVTIVETRHQIGGVDADASDGSHHPTRRQLPVLRHNDQHLSSDTNLITW